MQFKINRKSKHLVLTSKQGRQEYVVTVLLEGLAEKNLDDIFSKLEKISGRILVVPNMGYIFKDDKLVQDFAYYNGKFLKHNKVAIMTQGNFSVDDVEIYTYKEDNKYIFVRVGKLTIGIISDYVNAEDFNIEKLPDTISEANIIIAPVKLAPKLLSADFPVYIFLGDSDVFEKSTGITNYEKKDTLNIKKVDTGLISSRTIYVLEL